MRNGFVIIHVLGAVQGFFLAAILLSKRRDSAANRLLAALMAAFGLDLAMAVYHASGYDAVFPPLIGLDFPLALLYGPLLYLYARMLSRRAPTVERHALWHFVPFLLLVLFLLPFYLQSGATKLAYLQAPEADLRLRAMGIVNHAKLVHGLLYIGATLVLLGRHRRQIRDTHSSTEAIDLRWLRNLVIGTTGLTGLAAVLYVFSVQADAPVLGLDPANPYDDYTLLGVALLVYAIGYLGLRQPEVFDRRWAQALVSADEASSAEPDRPRYAKSGMDEAAARQYRQDLIGLMEHDHLYRRPDLTLKDLADALSISPHNLTEVINTQLGQTFYDLVNGYRVREVQARLADPANDHLTLLALGLDAGFNSKSSFNAVFKKHARMTPSQYRAQAKALGPAPSE